MTLQLGSGPKDLFNQPQIRLYMLGDSGYKIFRLAVSQSGKEDELIGHMTIGCGSCSEIFQECFHYEFPYTTDAQFLETLSRLQLFSLRTSALSASLR